MSDNDPYCMECGSETLAYQRTVANGDEWRCKDCGHVFLWDEPKEDDDK